MATPLGNEIDRLRARVAELESENRELQAAANGYLHVRTLPDGRVVGVSRVLTTYGLHVGIENFWYATRYCYQYRGDAVDACLMWDGTGHPPGPWVKQKPEELLGPGALSG